MGQMISAVQDAQKAIDEKKEKEAQDLLNVMYELSKTKMQLFHAKILASGPQDKMLPIADVVDHNFIIRCSVDGKSEIGDTVKSAVNNVASGNFTSAITDVLQLGLNELFGSSSGAVAERENYFVVVGPLSGIFRVDYYMYSYTYSSQTASSIAKNVLCVSYTVSAVNVDNIRQNTLRVLLGRSFSGLAEDKLQAMLKELTEALRAEKTERLNEAVRNAGGAVSVSSMADTSAALRKVVLA